MPCGDPATSSPRHAAGRTNQHSRPAKKRGEPNKDTSRQNWRIPSARSCRCEDPHRANTCLRLTAFRIKAHEICLANLLNHFSPPPRTLGSGPNGRDEAGTLGQGMVHEPLLTSPEFGPHSQRNPWAATLVSDTDRPHLWKCRMQSNKCSSTAIYLRVRPAMQRGEPLAPQGSVRAARKSPLWRNLTRATICSPRNILSRHPSP